MVVHACQSGLRLVPIDPRLAALYPGRVMHHRQRPVDHRFRYRVLSLLVDIDRLDDINSRLRLFAVDRLAPLAFWHRDHGPRDGSTLRPWVEAQLRAAHCADRPMRIMLLSMPRLFGFIFNPLSIYFCYDEQDRLASIIYEVKNTFGGQHAYVVPPPANADRKAFSHGCDKLFFVSPFIDMGAHYQFHLRDPGQRLTLAIRETDDLGVFFVASHTAHRQNLSDRAILKSLLSHGLMSVKVWGGIHYEALWLWLKGAPYFSRDVKEG